MSVPIKLVERTHALLQGPLKKHGKGSSNTPPPNDMNGIESLQRRLPEVSRVGGHREAVAPSHRVLPGHESYLHPIRRRVYEGGSTEGVE